MRKDFVLRLLAMVMVLLCCVLLRPAQAAAEEMKQGPYTYEITNGEVTITDCKATTAGALSIPASINGYPVTAIGDSAFFACKKLTAVTVPDGVTYIGRFAFGSCSALKTLTIPSSVRFVGQSAFSSCSALTYNVYENIKYLGSSQNPYHVLIQTTQTAASSCTIHPNTKILYDRAFYNCANLTQITIPAGVTVIGKETFSGCSGLSAVVIPAGVTSIDYRAFYQCNALASVTLPSSVTTLGKEVFTGCADAAFQTYGGVKYLGNGKNRYDTAVGVSDSTVTAISLHPDTRLIANSAFEWRESLTEAHIPDGVAIIGEDAFCGTGLQEVTIPNSVVAMGASAFASCSNLTSVTLPDGITHINFRLFHDSSSLTDVVIPDSVKTIGEEAFFACENLVSVTFGKGVTAIGKSAFQSTKLTVVNIPAGITDISVHAFNSCDYLTGFRVDENNPVYSNDDRGVLFNKDKTTLLQAAGGISRSYGVPKSVKTLAESAFSSCKNLTGVILPEGITEIPDGTFYMCKNLTSVVIPDSVTAIGDYAFQFCESLKDVFYTGTQSQWTTVLSNTGSYNTYLQEAMIHYNYVPQADSLVVYTDRIDLRMPTNDRITLQAGVVDGVGVYTDPSGITFQITDGSLVDVELTGYEEDCFYIQLRGVNPGTTTVTFSDTKHGYAVAVPITVFENTYPAYTLNNIPEISALGLTANFANFNGLYIDSCEYQLKDDQSARVSFDAYNTNFTYGLVEVYQENGQLYNVALIDKMAKNNTSLKEVYWDGGVCFVRALADGSISNYRGGFVSKHTHVEVDIPKNGYIKISCDPVESDIVALVNYSHLLVSALSLVGEANGFDPDAMDFPKALTKNLLEDAAAAQFREDGSKIFSRIMKDEIKELTITATTVGDFVDTLTKQMIDFKGMELITKSLADSGVGFAEDVFAKLLGKFGVALKTVFIIGKCENLVLSYNDAVNTIGGGAITIQNQGGGVRAATHVKLESEVDFEPDVALQTYQVEMDEEFLEYVQQADQETYEILTESVCHTYNISLLKNDQEVQHSDYVTVYIPIREDLRTLALAGHVRVYRIEEDGSLTDMDAVVEDGCMRFVTDHFSMYTLVGKEVIPGDIDGNGTVDKDDAVYLLLHALFGEAFYPTRNAPADIDGNGAVNKDDAVYLLLHTMFGETRYPLNMA